jgi:branched-chain amino acid transport system ATP-binding protein
MRGAGGAVRAQAGRALIMTMLLQAVNVSKSYGAYQALRNVSLHVADGEFISVVGPNGAGKTTLVNVLTGLLKPSSGSVSFQGANIAGIGPVELARRGMARSFQLVNIFPELTVGETLAVAVTARLKRICNPFRSLRKDDEVTAETERIAGILGLKDKLQTLLDIASAFALSPEVILLDEPTSGISTGDKHGIMRILVDAAKEAGIRAIVQVEHDMDLVANYSDRIIALQEGTVLADMRPAEFFADPAMIAAVVGTKPPTYIKS